MNKWVVVVCAGVAGVVVAITMISVAYAVVIGARVRCLLWHDLTETGWCRTCERDALRGVREGRGSSK